MSRGVRLFPVGRRGARLIERQPAVRFPGPLICRSRLPTRASVHATAALAAARRLSSSSK
jgi:hypothetical protein